MSSEPSPKRPRWCKTVQRQSPINQVDLTLDESDNENDSVTPCVSSDGANSSAGKTSRSSSMSSNIPSMALHRSHAEEMESDLESSLADSSKPESLQDQLTLEQALRKISALEKALVEKDRTISAEIKRANQVEKILQQTKMELEQSKTALRKREAKTKSAAEELYQTIGPAVYDILSTSDE